jgi:hypothetical protein
LKHNNIVSEIAEKAVKSYVWECYITDYNNNWYHVEGYKSAESFVYSIDFSAQFCDGIKKAWKIWWKDWQKFHQ